MRILNCYCGIGGNRRLWTPKGDEHEIVGIELNPAIAKIYQDFFPQDKVIITDAHQYLLEHFKEFDFIWSSPPCPTHSFLARTNIAQGHFFDYPDMRLYQEIILLKYIYKKSFCVENVRSYYKPLICPQEVGSHYFWANFFIHPMKIDRCHPRKKTKGYIKMLQGKKGFDLSEYKKIDKVKLLHNCTEPELGLHILNESKNNIQCVLFK